MRIFSAMVRIASLLYCTQRPAIRTWPRAYPRDLESQSTEPTKPICPSRGLRSSGEGRFDGYRGAFRLGFHADRSSAGRRPATCRCDGGIAGKSNSRRRNRIPRPPSWRARRAPFSRCIARSMRMRASRRMGEVFICWRTKAVSCRCPTTAFRHTARWTSLVSKTG